MKKVTFTILLLFCFLSSYAQVDKIAGNMILKDLISHLKHEIQSLINEVDYAYSKNAFETKQNLEILLSNLENTSNSILDKTFDEINNTEQKFFQDLNNTIDKLLEVEDFLMRDVNASINNFSTALARVPFADKSPRITDFKPRILLADNNLTTQNISIYGSLLEEATPSLNLAGVQCELLSKTSTELKFRCDCTKIKDAKNFKDLNGSLEIWKKKKVFNKRKKSIFKISLENIPQKIADVQLNIYDQKINTQTYQRKRNFSMWNTHCSKSKPFTWTIDRTNNQFKIDPNSISVKINKISKKSRYSGVNKATETGFQLSGRVTNSGKCISYGFGKAKDARGNMNATVYFTETKETKKIVSSKIDKEEVFWKKGKVFNLPPNTVGYQLIVSQVDGSTFIITKDQKINDCWLNILYDKKTNSIIINPKKISNALK